MNYRYFNLLLLLLIVYLLLLIIKQVFSVLVVIYGFCFYHNFIDYILNLIG